MSSSIVRLAHAQCRTIVVFVGPTFGAVCYITGTTQGRTVLHRENSYPLHALGDVTFLWRPVSKACCERDGSGSLRQLWIWTHPACYSDILTELKKVFKLTETDCTSAPIVSGCGTHHTSKGTDQRKRKNDGSCPKRPKLSKNSTANATVVNDDTIDNCAVNENTAIAHSAVVEQSIDVSDNTVLPSSAKSLNVKVESRGTSSDDSNRRKRKKTTQCGEQHLLSKTDLVRQVYENSKVRLESLKDELCRFRVIGPKSHKVIVDALCLAEAANVHESESMIDDVDVGEEPSAEVQNRWWDDYVVSEHGSAEYARQTSSWKKVAAIQNAAELPQFSVHGLTVRDPRLFLPQHRTSVSYSASGDCLFLFCHIFIVNRHVI